MKKLILLILLLIPTLTYSAGVGVINIDTDCNQAKYYVDGAICQDSDDKKVYKGTGSAVEEIGTGAGAEVDPIVTTETTGFTITRGTTPKTLTVTGDVTISGTPQLSDQDLTDIAALSCSAYNLLGKSAANAWECKSALDISSITDGVLYKHGTDTYGIVFDTDALDTSNKTITWQNVSGIPYISGGTDVPVADGGTSKSAWTLYAIPFLSGTTTFGEIAIGTNGQCLKTNATADGYEWGTCGSGYTNLTSFIAQTAWRLFYSNADGDVTELALGADGTYLKSNGASAAPTFAIPAGSGTVNTGAQYSLAYYPSPGTTVDDIAGLTTDANGYSITTVKGTSIDSILLRQGTTGGETTGFKLEANPAVCTTTIVTTLPDCDTTPAENQAIIFGAVSGGKYPISYGGPYAPVASPTFTGTVSLPASTSFTTPNIGAATGTSLAVTGILDGKATLATCGATCSITALTSYIVCTENCTITPPAPAAGVQICTRNGNNGSYTIIFAALGATKYYEKPDHTGYGTATTGTLSATAAITNSICLIGLDTAHYLIWGAPIGTWTAN